MNTEPTESELRPDLWVTSLLFVGSAIIFFPMIMNPVSWGLFDASKSDAELMAFIDDHFSAIRLLFTGMGVAELVLGAAFWRFGRQISSLIDGGRARAAVVTAWFGLTGALLNTLARWWIWTDDATGFFEFGQDIPVWALGVQLGGWVLYSLTLLILGYLTIRGPWPTWLGIVLALCGLLVYPTGFLPLWFYVAAIALGVAGLVRYRANGPLAGRQLHPSPGARA